MTLNDPYPQGYSFKVTPFFDAKYEYLRNGTRYRHIVLLKY